MSKIGEVIEAGTATFVAQCYELHQPPPLGSLVRTRDSHIEIFGVVSAASTHSIEEGRRPVARGDPVSEEDVFKAHPQLARLLCTDFTAIVVGHRNNGDLLQYLPPHPARLHSFVEACDAKDARDFSASFGFLRMLAADQSPWLDEVISACLRNLCQAHEQSEAMVIAAARELAPLMGGDFQRLGDILKRIRGR